MSADDLPQYHHVTPGADDPYATRSLHVSELPTIDAPHVAPRARPDIAPRRRARVGLVLNSLLLLLVVFVVSAGVGLFYLDRSYDGKIYPNVSIQGVQVGEMTPQQAEAAIAARYEAFLSQPLTLTYGGRVWRPTPDDLGLHFAFDEAAAAAYRAGRGNGLLENLQEVREIWNNGHELALNATIDQQHIREYVVALSDQYNQAPVDARVRLDGITVTTTLARPGRQVLVDETVRDITAALQTLAPQSVELQTRTLAPRLSDEQAAQAKARIESFVQGPFVMRVQDREYRWEAEDIARMLTIARVPQDAGTDRVLVEVNPYFVDRMLRQIVDETGRGSVNPRVAWNGGDLKIIRPGRAGWRVDEAQARAQILAGLPTAQRDLDLPIVEIAPTVNESNLHTLGIKELVSIGRSDFTGSAAYRIHNIGVGMDILNGILLGPGEEFSFNRNIGSIDQRNGFVEGYAIVQNRTQLEFGGGICQDSTTMFRAAFWAGLPITERWGHSFYISWYDKYAFGQAGNGPGMDATIFTGGPDLRFVNDTGHWMLIQSYSNPNSGVAEVAFYGTKPNRTVTVSRNIYDRVPAPTKPVIIYDKNAPPGSRKQTDTARGGMTIDVYRTVTENGVPGKPELFRTKFKPWPNIYIVGPELPPPPPAPAPEPQPADAAQPAPEQQQPAPAPEQPAPAPEQGGQPNG